MNKPISGKAPQRFIKDTRKWYSSNVFLLYLVPLFLVPATIMALAKGHVGAIIINAGGYALYLLAASLLRRGLQAQAVYEEKRITKAPKWPLKTLAAVVVAGTTFLIAWLGAQYTFSVALAFGGGAFLGMYLSYGFDPRAPKPVLGDHGYSIEEITNIIDEAERVIAKLEHANQQIRNAEFNARIERICATAKNIIAELEANPAAIRRTRKFLLVYLEGASKVTSGYANTHLQAASTELEQNFRNVLDSIETVFSEQKHKLLQEDLFDLDVQMEVLATQLKHEGIV
ncbi:MAG: 5-bromo-4-chloroindolyl phosphate hydrolysis family protein [Methylococcales bacterium]